MYGVYDPLIASNNFLERGFIESINITPMKLQKLLYFLYGEYLRNTGKPLFSERFEAWQYGPVLSSVYNYFKHYRAKAIKEYSSTNQRKFLKVDESADDEFKKSLDAVWSKYKGYTGIQLSELTHQKDTAWYKAWQNRALFIDDDDIKNERCIEVQMNGG